jgi:predicted DNA-binding transcriptional regulator YafY
MYGKKVIILCVLEVLKKYTDERHLMTQSEIAGKIYDDYKLSCERKSVASSLNALSDFGFDIAVIRNDGYFLRSRELELSEVKFLIDAVLGSRNISSKAAAELAERLNGFLSVHGRKKFSYIKRADEVSRGVNKDFFLNIDIITDAIEGRKKLRFKYNRYNYKGDLILRRDRPYVVNPYYMLNNNGKYYLVCNTDGHEGISNYRLDFMTGLSISDDYLTPSSEIDKDFNITDYANQNIYPFGGETVAATLRLLNDGAVSSVIDWYGKNARLYKKPGSENFYASVTASEKALVYWALQFAPDVELIAPSGTRAKVAALAKEVAARYE